jgi:hypothetical protein
MMTQRTKTTAAVVLFLVAFWLWVSELPLTPLADARPVPDADDERKVTHVDFGSSERKAKGA